MFISFPLVLLVSTLRRQCLICKFSVTSLNSAPGHCNSCTAHALKLRHAHTLHVVSHVNGAIRKKLKWSSTKSLVFCSAAVPRVTAGWQWCCKEQRCRRKFLFFRSYFFTSWVEDYTKSVLNFLRSRISKQCSWSQIKQSPGAFWVLFEKVTWWLR